MAESGDLEARVAALESQVAEIAKLAERVRRSEQDAAAARVLAGGADRDVTEIREEIRAFRQATVSSLNALRAGQADTDRRLADLDRRMTDGFATTAAGQRQIVELLTTLIAGQGEPPAGTE